MKTEIKCIYDQVVDAVAATIKQLYELIETDAERVQKLVATATALKLSNAARITRRPAPLLPMTSLVSAVACMRLLDCGPPVAHFPQQAL